MGDLQSGVDLQALDAWDRCWVAGCGGVDDEQRQLACTGWDGDGSRSKCRRGRDSGCLCYRATTRRGIGGDRYGVLAGDGSNEGVRGIRKAIPRGDSRCAGWERIVSESSGATSEVRRAVSCAVGLGQH